jgi:O-antigen/teichoic acid export membrane protein
MMNSETDFIGWMRRSAGEIGRKAVSSDFIHKVSETFLTRLGVIGLGFVTSIITARILGPEGRGILAVAITINAIGIQFSNLGLHSSSMYLVAKDKGTLSALTGNGLLVSLVMGCLAGLVIWGVDTLSPGTIGLQGGFLFAALVWIPCGLGLLFIQNLILGLQDVRVFNQIELATKVVFLLFLGIFLTLHIEAVEWFIQISLGGAFLTGLVWGGIRLFRHWQARIVISLRVFKETFAYGVKAYFFQLFQFLLLKIDLILVNAMLGPQQAGYYSIAVMMTDYLYTFPTVTTYVHFPKISSFSERAKKWTYTKKVALGIGAIMIAFSVLLALAAVPIVRYLYGVEFLPAVPAVLWLLPAIVFLSINAILMTYIVSLGYPMIMVYAPAIAAALNITLNLQLIPRLGIVGASISSTIAYGLMLAISALYLLYQHRQDATEMGSKLHDTIP